MRVIRKTVATGALQTVRGYWATVISGMFSHVIGHESSLDICLFAVIKHLPKATSGRKATSWLSVPD